MSVQRQTHSRSVQSFYNDAHSLKLILHPSRPLKKWQPDRNIFSFPSVSKNVLWKSNQNKMKRFHIITAPFLWSEDDVFSRWAEGVDTEIVKFGSQGQNSGHVSCFLIILHMSEVKGLKQERTWSIGEAVCYVQQHTNTLAHGCNLLTAMFWFHIYKNVSHIPTFVQQLTARHKNFHKL